MSRQALICIPSHHYPMDRQRRFRERLLFDAYLSPAFLSSEQWKECKRIKKLGANKFLYEGSVAR